MAFIMVMGKQEMMLMIYLGTLWTEINNERKAIRIKWNVGFGGEGKSWVPGEKSLGAE